MSETIAGKYDGFSIAELQAKRRFTARWVLNPLRRDWKDDPRAPEALLKYRAEYGTINQVLIRKLRERREENGKPEPPAQAVGVDPVSLTGRAHSR